MIIHDLKTLEEHWNAVYERRKTFELRFDDRGFKVGHYLNLRRIRKLEGESGASWAYSPIWVPGEKTDSPRHEIHSCLVRVTHVLRYDAMKAMGCHNGIGLTPGWCVLSIERL
jgi:hypothetical protein